MAPRGQISAGGATAAPIAAIVFDLDGTLIDSRSDIIAATNHALVALGFAPQPSPRITRFIGDGARKLLQRAAGLEEADPRLQPLVDTFVAYYAQHPVDGTILMPGAKQALDELSDLQLAVCTNKPRPATEAILEALELTARFSVVMAAGDVPREKPDPEALFAAARALCVEVGQMVMVGDGPQDIQCGHAAGTRTVGVSGPIVPLERLSASGPDVLIRSLGELPSLIRNWQSGQPNKQ